MGGDRVQPAVCWWETQPREALSTFLLADKKELATLLSLYFGDILFKSHRVFKILLLHVITYFPHGKEEQCEIDGHPPARITVHLSHPLHFFFSLHLAVLRFCEITKTRVQ
jgi:hypothetical protein